ncbi:MAG: P1 family peptidase [Bdellovibrionota bacterium]
MTRSLMNRNIVHFVFSSALMMGIVKVGEAARLKYNFDEFLVGTAENPKGPTGCTVFTFPKGALAAIDVRGGAAAVREQSSIEEGNSWGAIDALVLAGGSTYGLDAASGVMRELLKQRGGKVDFDSIPSVPAAIVYDFAGRDNAIYPDADLGAKAFRNATKNTVKLGPYGGGANVTVGKFFGREFAEKSGQGAAFVESEGIKIFALSVVNAVGNIMNDDGSVLAGSKDPKTGARLSIPQTLLKSPKSLFGDVTLGNTTISILITNAKLDRGELKRLAIMVHTSMARAIEPFHSAGDGDTLFVVSTYHKGSSAPETSPSVTRIGILASAMMQEAVRRSVTK